MPTQVSTKKATINQKIRKLLRYRLHSARIFRATSLNSEKNLNKPAVSKEDMKTSPKKNNIVPCLRIVTG